MTDNTHTYLRFDDLSSNNDMYKDKYIQLLADFDNYKKRTKMSELNAYDSAVENAVLTMLNVYDDLERTLAAIDIKKTPEQRSLESDVTKFEAGVRMIYENFEKSLNQLDCYKVECRPGDKFDVSTMKAVMTRKICHNEGYDEDDVVSVVQSGWKLHGKMIRPASVVVGVECHDAACKKDCAE